MQYNRCKMADGFGSAVKILSDDEEVEKILASFPELNYGALGYYEITALQVRIKI